MNFRRRVMIWRLKAATFALGASYRLAANNYAGASMSRLFAGWVAGRLSANNAIEPDMMVLRDRARELARNNAIVAGFLQELANNLVGPKGIVLQPRVTNAKGEPVKTTNWAITSAWDRWGQPRNASLDGVDSWIDMQRQHVIAIWRDGESIIRGIPGADNEFGFAVQLVDPDLLDESLNTPAKEGQNEIRMGVELDAFGKPIAYHLLRHHPTEMLRSTGRSDRHERIPAEWIIHDFHRDRPGQVRGITRFAPVLAYLQMLGGYLEADLTAARLQASQGGAIVTKDPELVAAWLGYLATANGGQPKKVEPTQFAVEPGMYPQLPPGQEIQNITPTHPSMQAEAFTRIILRHVARALGVSYHTLTGDTSQANYSSLRAGLLPERDHWRAQQVWLSSRCHVRVYEWWLPRALASQQLKVDRRVLSELAAHTWKGRGWKWVDPVKDLQAAELEIALGLNSRQRLHGEAGTNFEDTVDDLAYEAQYALAQKVDIAPEKKQDAPASPTKDEDDETTPGARSHLRAVNE